MRALFLIPLFAGFVFSAIGQNDSVVQLSSSVVTKHGSRSVRVSYSPFNPNSPLILASPGLSDSASGFDDLAREWADAGFFVVAVEHDDGMGSYTPTFYAAIRSEDLWERRAADIKAVLNWVEKESNVAGAFQGLVNPAEVGLVGFGFGGYTVSALSGLQHSFGFFGKIGETIPGLRALLLIGTPSDVARAPRKKAWGDVKVPLFVISGALDHAGGFRTRDENRQGPFDASVGPGKYVLFPGVDASGYLGASQKRFPLIVALTTGFWNAYLAGDVDWENYFQELEAERSVTKSRK